MRKVYRLTKDGEGSPPQFRMHYGGGGGGDCFCK